MVGKQWSDDVIKCVLDTCVEEIQRVGRNGQSLQKESWVKLANNLKEKFDMILTQKQIRNGFDTLKAKYVGWCFLRNKTGNIYDPRTNMFTLKPEEWEDFRQGHPRAMSLKTRPLPYIDLFIAVFEGISASGANQWTSTQKSSTVSSSSFNQQVQTLQLEDTNFHGLDDENDDEYYHENDFQTGEEVPSNNEGPSSRTTPNVDEVRPKKKTKTSKSTINLDELASDMQAALKHMVKSMDGPSTQECYEKLKLVGLEPVDPLFLAAYTVFNESVQMRATWMQLPSDPEVLKGWIKMTGKRFGFL